MCVCVCVCFFSPISEAFMFRCNTFFYDNGVQKKKKKKKKKKKNETGNSFSFGVGRKIFRFWMLTWSFCLHFL